MYLVRACVRVGARAHNSNNIVDGKGGGIVLHESCGGVFEKNQERSAPLPLCPPYTRACSRRSMKRSFSSVLACAVCARDGRGGDARVRESGLAGAQSRVRKCASVRRKRRQDSSLLRVLLLRAACQLMVGGLLSAACAPAACCVPADGGRTPL